ncbi:hypothetical protein QQ008_08985 [Fulvivirgaceae bacterium BMA10]|uniref:Uncharacterized protein n=1 Tax=Splendidivirga corallicola TaxID=3051826 RepID=A0ABT8KPM6_9BACT|nr:hypothetical protein [Fulvivirgaceae bacterium BMA10]
MKYLSFDFFFNLIILGLIQIWVIGILYALNLDSLDFNWFDLIKDGGIFIYSCTLVVMSHLMLIKINQFSINPEKEKKLSFAVMFVIILVALVCYMDGKVITDENKISFSFKSSHHYVQLICFVTSLVYSATVEIKVKKFNSNLK